MNRAREFRDRFLHKPWLTDGAMGTMLQARTSAGLRYEELSISSPELVIALHREYIEAGAEIIRTNTFRAHTPELRRTAAKLAREAATGRAFIAASVGPEWTDFEGIEDVDAVFLETFRDPESLAKAAEAVRNQLSHEIVILSHMCVTGGVGLNCIDPKTTLDIVTKMSGTISALPSAGIPKKIGERFEYPVSPWEMAEIAVKLREMGVRVIGGCCGTTPEHIRAMSQALKPVN